MAARHPDFWLVLLLLFGHCLSAPVGEAPPAPAGASTSATSSASGPASCPRDHAYLETPLPPRKCSTFDSFRNEKSWALDQSKLGREYRWLDEAKKLPTAEERRNFVEDDLEPKSSRDHHQSKLQSALAKITPPSFQDGRHSLPHDQVDPRAKMHAASIFRELQSQEAQKDDDDYGASMDAMNQRKHEKFVEREQHLRDYFQAANRMTVHPDQAPPSWGQHLANYYRSWWQQKPPDSPRAPRPQQDPEWAARVDKLMGRGGQETPAARELWALHARKMIEANNAKNEAFKRAHEAYDKFGSDSHEFHAARWEYSNHAAMEDVHALVCGRVPRNLAEGPPRNCGDLYRTRKHADRAAKDQVRADLRRNLLEGHERTLEAEKRAWAERMAEEARRKAQGIPVPKPPTEEPGVEGGETREGQSQSRARQKASRARLAGYRRRH